MTAREIEAEPGWLEPEGEFGIRPEGWVKRVLPRTMFGRSLLIVVVPLILLQAIATWVFYDRHWAAVSWRLSAAVAGDVGLLIEAMKLADSPGETARLLERAAALTDLDLTLNRGDTLPSLPPASGSPPEDQLTQAMQGRVTLPYRITNMDDPRGIRIEVQLPEGVLAVEAPRKRLSSYTTYIFVMWMVGSSLVLLAVAIVFLRNQVKSLRRLAAAADGFGKGRPVPFFKVEGAVEIRQAALAFIIGRRRDGAHGLRLSRFRARRRHRGARGDRRFAAARGCRRSDAAREDPAVGLGGA